MAQLFMLTDALVNNHLRHLKKTSFILHSSPAGISHSVVKLKDELFNIKGILACLNSSILNDGIELFRCVWT